ncbi:hypothetical protein DMP23_43455 [Amycolatopsis sp. A1MSW2902]|uniref:hypothetical protein n=1 Tax=Amycolatopsis sp. A1MSW2902 TaxID=687413 RepID=UPI00307F070F
MTAVTHDDLWELVEECHRRGWTDGLPVVPPTRGLVDRFLAAGGWDPAEPIAVEPVRGRTITAGKLAANAVLAGCLPEHVPVVAAALRGMSAPEFTWHGTVTSTGGAAPLIIVNGPARDRLGMNYGTNLFGPGCRANSAIGRAVRLVLRNCLDAHPGILDRSTQGNFGKYSGCFAEHEAASPWEPFHASRGFRPEESTVTVFAAESAHNILCHGTSEPERILTLVADTMAALGSFSAGESLLVLGPEHAHYLGVAGWSRRDVQEFVFARAARTVADLKRAGKIEDDHEIRPGDEDTVRHRGESPADILVLVGGGEAGGHSAFFPSWSRLRSSLAVTVAC